MHLNISQKDFAKVQELLKIKEYNIASAEALFSFSYADLAYDQIDNFLDLDLSNFEEEFFFEKYFSNVFISLDKEKYINNPYAKKLKGVSAKKGKYQLKELTIKKYRPLPYDDIQIEDLYLEKSSQGYFLDDFTYPALLENDTVWMSLDPDEINTMAPIIEQMHGKILIFGLGMGYFPYMASLNNKVEKIVIVENNMDIINFFKEFIASKLDNKIPFEIVYDDAFHYLENHPQNDFDCMFMDIWHNPEDGFPLYWMFLHSTKQFKGKCYYWLEKSLLAMGRRCLLTLVEESIQGYQDKDYQKAKNTYDKIINKLYFLTKDMNFTSYESLYDFLSDASIKKLLTE